MIIKPRSYPIRLRNLEALHRRLPPSHPKRSLVQDSLARVRAGYQGEKSIDFHLKFIPQKDYLIIHDLRLFDGQHFFQMDTVLVSRKFILILEVKNVSGSLCLNSDIHQLTRTSNGKEDTFPDPILQIERQQMQLSKWIESYSSKLPIEAFVLFTNKSAILHLKNDKDSERILKSEGLLSRFNMMEQRYSEEKINSATLHLIASQMVREHTDVHQNILGAFGIRESELLSGVHCQACTGKLVWKRRTWECISCFLKSKDAHIQALQDYACLRHAYISNREARAYLHIDSEHIVKRMLVNLGGKKIGATKSRKYEIPL